MSFWTDRSVFVTGATGLLGSALVEELHAHRALVTCLVRDWVPGSRLLAAMDAGDAMLSRVNTVRGELEDAEVILRALNEYEVDTVFHLGAQTIVGTASRSPAATFEANIRGTWNVLEACRSLPDLVKRVIIASSDKAYGESARLPYSEDMPLNARYPYDVSKSCADLIALSYFHTFATPVAITRSGNLFGGGDLNFNRLVPGTIRSALRGESPVIRSDGTPVRDYFYVRDAVAAYMLLAERLTEPGICGEAFNFGYEHPTSVLELVDLILQLSGAAVAPKIIANARSEIQAQYLDCRKASERLGWKPEHTLAQGLAETIEWYRAKAE